MALITRPKPAAQKITVVRSVGRLTPAEVLAIRADTAPQPQIAARYGVSQPLISQIKNRRAYGWVVGPDSERPEPKGQFKRRLSDEEVRAIRESDDRASALAERYGISSTYVWQLRHGYYREVAGGPIGRPRNQPVRITDELALAVFKDALELTKRHGISLRTLRTITHSRFYTVPKAARGAAKLRAWAGANNASSVPVQTQLPRERNSE